MVSRSDIDDKQTGKPGYPDREEPMTATEARQGSYGRPVLIVLLGGLLLAMILWIPAEWWGNASAPDNPANEAPATTAPSPAEQNPSTQPQSQP